MIGIKYRKGVLLLGDSLEVLSKIGANKIDVVVTDPPYGLKFMNKKWDYQIPDIEICSEILRVLKPGGHMLSFGGARTYHRLVCNVEDAGFEIRDTLMWIFGSGFPKSLNISKGIDKMKIQTNEAKQWDGWGTALKPAFEPIVLARKPLSEKTIVENVLKWGTGGLNINECRIDSRRWPANVIHDGSEEVMEEFDKAGIRKTGDLKPYKRKNRSFCGGGRMSEFVTNSYKGYSSSGSAARFFYCAKASPSERGKGNNHPTVKPIKLIEYLIKLITPPGGVVLDPFIGSGTTAIAAINLNFRWIGVEINKDYYKIAKERIKNSCDVLL